MIISKIHSVLSSVDNPLDGQGKWLQQACSWVVPIYRKLVAKRVLEEVLGVVTKEFDELITAYGA